MGSGASGHRIELARRFGEPPSSPPFPAALLRSQPAVGSHAESVPAPLVFPNVSFFMSVSTISVPPDTRNRVESLFILSPEEFTHRNSARPAAIRQV